MAPSVRPVRPTTGPALAGLLLAVLGACSSTTRPAMTRETAQRLHDIAHERDVDAVLREAGRARLDGFPTELSGDGFGPGERLLYGIEAWDEGEVERCLLLVEAVAPAAGNAPGPIEVELEQDFVRGGDRETARRLVESPAARLRIRLLDLEGGVLAEDSSEVPRLLHEAGWFAWARLHDGHGLWRLPEGMLTGPRTFPPPELRDRDWGRSAVWAMLQHLMGNGAIEALLARLPIGPRFGELGDFISGTIDLYLGLERPRVVDQPVPELPAGTRAFECGLSMYREGRQLLVVNVVVVPSAGPMVLTGGIVTMTGYRGGDPERRFVMRLLAARG
ncbi:MAG: hypothetical protein R3F30_11825 [Planctomycetota bacterium]